MDLEKAGQLLKIKEEVDPHLEMAAIHLQVYAAGGPAILFEKVKGSKYSAASNIFGTLSRSEYIFRNTLPGVRKLIDFKNNPIEALKHPIENFSAAMLGLQALPLKNPAKKPVLFEEIKISDLPQIHHWPMDGGAFVTLPQVYTEDIDKPGVISANIGMYRIQLSGNGITAATECAGGPPMKMLTFKGSPFLFALVWCIPIPR